MTTVLPQAPRVAAVILAAGLSSRMEGGFKPLMPLGGATVLERAAVLLHQCGAEHALVVAGNRACEVNAEAQRLGLACVENPDFLEGMFSSVRAGLAALPGGFDAVLVLPVDIPLVRPATVRLLLASWRGQAVAYPTFAGERGHPPLLAARTVPSVLAWDGNRGLRGALEAVEMLEPALETPCADANILFDLDTPEDYREAALRAARLSRPGTAEALALLALHGVPERGLAHARAVARVAVALADALNARRVLSGALPPLDTELIESAALLHDIAKGRPGHEALGGRILDAAGFPEAARIVEAHRDLSLPEEAPLTGREVVYLADKLARGAQLVEVSRRFQEKLDRFGADPEAFRAISGRRDRALSMLARVEREAGWPVAEILRRAGLPAPVGGGA
ncbi:Molybdenum cofactor cytidylyltransferase [Fundidesulfovibrio magnetotacticus]|uniref:Molybdenum cofactor cytidylyltransferase n=1 Tax=Fundidesulfovibrio magnetotacticus TaxID=2730080 RepID=A0A6V8LPZ5_9BACT|nr:NTP transferase domain-containing protein [Fundidesulfovibrio magnetotacticus]GFK92189.1 Molybdenum cofactor cytidylyltransferase [Fundidesulfovibrio magnetotacticus]